MPDDFVLKVSQIAQYPAATSVNPKNGDVLLLQQNGAGGAYQSLDPRVLFATALDQGGFINLAPNNGIAWNGASLTWGAGQFTFSEPVAVPSLQATSVFVNGLPVATQQWVTSLIAALPPEVNTFNGRCGNVQLEDIDVLRAGGVLAINPHFAGVVTAPTLWNFSDSSDSVATTAWVQGAIINAGTNGFMVRSFNGRGGCVVLTAADVSAALTVPGIYGLANTPPLGDTSKRIATTMFVDETISDLRTSLQEDISNIASGLDQTYAPLNSPQFTGIPTAPTAPAGTTTGQLATTAFVQNAITASTTGVSSFNTRTGAVVFTTSDLTAVGGALIASPAFTGTPTAPTPPPGDNTTHIATTAFVEAAIAGISAGVVSFNTRTGAVTLTLADVTAVGAAPLASPAFTGTPTAPTPAPADDSTHLATTAYVTTAIAALPAPVTSFNGRTGAITFQASDLSAVNGALLASPAFTGTPSAPTAIAGTSSNQLATTAFVQAAVTAGMGGVASFNGRTGAVTLTAGDVTGVGGALLAGPTFTGVPSAPTAAPGTNSTQLATTAFIQAALSALNIGVTSFNSRTGTVTLIGADVSAAGGALTASPAFSGTPTGPTAVPGTSTTQLATTAFVMSALAAGGGVSSFNGRAGAVTLTLADITGAGGAPLASPALTGTPTAPTQAATDNSTNIATTAFVQGHAGRVLLMTQNVTTAVAAVVFSGATLFTSYQKYEIEIVDWPVTNSVGPVLQFSSDGVNYDNGTNYYFATGYSTADTTATMTNFGNATANWVRLAVNQIALANGTRTPRNMIIRLVNPSHPTQQKAVRFDGVMFNGAGTFQRIAGGGTWLGPTAGTTPPIQGVRLQFDSGNIAVGSAYNLYGVP
jgi:hypothetical protein